MKTLFSTLGILFLSINLQAQINYLKNADMTGVKLDFVGADLKSNINTPAIGTGWSGYYGTLKSLNMTTIKADDAYGDAIKLTATGTLTNLSDNPRLVQRVKCPVGIYRLKYWAKTSNGKNAKIAASVRATGNNVPAFVLNNYVNNGSLTTPPAHKLFTITDTWTEYTVEFDLTKTVDTFKPGTGTPLSISSVSGAQFPVICFNLWQSHGTANAEVLIDNVSFVQL